MSESRFRAKELHIFFGWVRVGEILKEPTLENVGDSLRVLVTMYDWRYFRVF